MTISHIVLVAALAAVACYPFSRPTANDYETNAYYFHVAREGIAEFLRASGRLPDSLLETCPSLDGSRCHWLPFGYRFTDAWDRSLRYMRVGAEYEVRSTGRDGRNGTADDLVFRPSAERALVTRAAGCYAVRLAWWPEFNAGGFRLDTLPVGYGMRAAAPNVAGYNGVHWEVIGPDSVAVSWFEIHHSRQLRLHVGQDSLVGYAAVGAGAASWRGTRLARHSVVAYRQPCGDRAG